MHIASNELDHISFPTRRSSDLNWDEIARVVEALDIPVIGNGDITAAEDVVAMRAHTNCAGVMIARGVFGNPWILDRKSTRLNSNHQINSYDVFCVNTTNDTINV